MSIQLTLNPQGMSDSELAATAEYLRDIVVHRSGKLATTDDLDRFTTRMKKAVLVRGEPGSGKSAVTAAIFDAADAAYAAARAADRSDPVMDEDDPVIHATGFVSSAPVPTAPTTPCAATCTDEEWNYDAVSAPPADTSEPDTTDGATDVSTHDRDAEGLPWDARIHASSKALNADGTWRQKRGVDKVLLDQVRAELRGMTAATSAPAVPPVPPPPAGIPVPPPPIAPGTPVEPQPLGFAQVMPRITAAIQAGTIDMAKVVAACQQVGVPALPALAAMPHLIPTVLTALGLDANG